MNLIPEAEFARWRSDVDILPHPRFPSSLAFRQAPDCQQSWLPAGRITDLPGFLQTAVSLARGDGSVCLYRKGGGAWYEGDDAPIGNHIIDRVLQGLGIPRDFEGAISFVGREWRDMYLLISTFFVWGWSVGEDLYIIPENVSCVLMTSHHGELFAMFPGTEALAQFQAAMASSGHPAR